MCVCVCVYQANWVNAAHFVHNNPDSVVGVVLVDSVQAPGSGSTPKALLPIVSRTVQMLEDAVVFTYCGQGARARPPVRHAHVPVLCLPL